jgi:release factor glutamine methyltransferase
MTSDGRSGSAPWTILKTLQWTAGYFREKGIEQARPDAEILLAHVLDCERIDLYLRYDKPLNPSELERYRTLIRRRARREPVAYITGHREFWSLDFCVTPDVLIPRPETERLVELVLEHCPAQRRLDVLELGVGSGAISVALCRERPPWRTWASDRSTRALAVARENARRHGCAGTIRFFAGDWFEPLAAETARFDLIVSNPPYISRRDLKNLEPEVAVHEPAAALDGGEQGTDCLERLIGGAPRFLNPGGRLFLEIGWDQGRAVEEISGKNGAYTSVTVHKDYARRDRVAQLVLQD